MSRGGGFFSGGGKKILTDKARKRYSLSTEFCMSSVRFPAASQYVTGADRRFFAYFIGARGRELR